MYKIIPLLLALLIGAGCASTKTVHPTFSDLPVPVPQVPKARQLRVASPVAPQVAQPNVQVLVARQATPPPAVVLGWDPSSFPVHVYYGVAPGAYTNVVDAGLASTVTISNLSFTATYYFAATAYVVGGAESDYSNEISFTTPTKPLPPGNFKIQASFADAIEGPWLPDPNFPVVSEANPFGNLFWRLQVSLQ